MQVRDRNGDGRVPVGARRALGRSEFATTSSCAQEALTRKDHSLAEQEFEKILALNPDLAGAHANLGIARYLQAKYDPAIRSFLRALEIQPDMTDVELFLGLSRARAGRIEEAHPALSKGFLECQRR